MRNLTFCATNADRKKKNKPTKRNQQTNKNKNKNKNKTKNKTKNELLGQYRYQKG